MGNLVRIIKGSTYILNSPGFVGDDGQTPTNCSSAPSCAVVREDGTALTSAVVSQANTGTGVYQAAITTTHTAALDWLQITWTGTMATGQVQVYRDVVEVVGAHYVTIPELRAQPGLSDTSKYPVALMREMRDEFESMVENVCSTAFVRRYQRDRIDGNGRKSLGLSRRNPRAVIAVTINGTVAAETFDLYPQGMIVRRATTFPLPDSTNGYRNIGAAYEHGYDAPPPQLKRQALKVIRADLLAYNSGVPDNAISQTFDGTTIRYSTPDPARGRPTGILSLDPILCDLNESAMGMY